MSFQIAISLADEWEYQVRQYKKTHHNKKVVTGRLMMLIDRDADKVSPMDGMWNHRDIAYKTCEILAERLGEEYDLELPRKLI